MQAQLNLLAQYFVILPDSFTVGKSAVVALVSPRSYVAIVAGVADLRVAVSSFSQTSGYLNIMRGQQLEVRVAA